MTASLLANLSMAAAPKARWASPSSTARSNQSAYSYHQQVSKVSIAKILGVSRTAMHHFSLTRGNSIPTLHSRSLGIIALKGYFLQQSGRYPESVSGSWA